MPKTPDEYAQVSVEGNVYKFKGNFHVIEPNQPIRNREGRLCGVTNPRDMTYVHSYGAEWVFFDGIAKGKIHATRCDNAACETKGFVYLPFRIFCPECLNRNTVIDVTDKVKKGATVYSFMITERTGAFNTLKKPIQFVNVAFEGVCTILMSYLPVGNPRWGCRLSPSFERKNRPTRSPTWPLFPRERPRISSPKDLPLGRSANRIK